MKLNDLRKSLRKAPEPENRPSRETENPKPIVKCRMCRKGSVSGELIPAFQDKNVIWVCEGCKKAHRLHPVP